MIVESTPEFDDDFLALSGVDQARVIAALDRAKAAPPWLPGLRFQKLPGATTADGVAIWYMRASDSIRITCTFDGAAIRLRKVGHHDMLRNP